MLMDTGEAFKDTAKNKIYLGLHRLFHSLGQWFINHCDMEPYTIEWNPAIFEAGTLHPESEFTTKDEELIDVADLGMTEKDMEDFGKAFLKNVDELAEIDES